MCSKEEIDKSCRSNKKTIVEEHVLSAGQWLWNSYTPSTSSQQTIKQVGVFEKVASPKFYKLNLSLTNKKQIRSITAFTRRKMTPEKTRWQCSG